MPMSDRAARVAYAKAYYRKNRDLLLSKQKERDAAADPELRAEYQRQYHEANKADLLEKQRARGRQNYAANKPAHRERQRRTRLKKYGISEAQKAALLQLQEHQCPICERFLAEQTVPSIDHCHVTGSVRGILCRRCNSALGLFEESPATLERAFEYLGIARRQQVTKLLSGATSTPSKTPSSEPSPSED
jgi:hypothetical protein